MKRPILSIIIPVYNVEEYVVRCLESCLNQDICSDEYELIVINDGSKDRSLEMIEDFVKSKRGISVLSQENQGLSMARNNGLEIAVGEYVWFVDSDDWIDPNCLGIIVQKLRKEHPDLLQIGYRFTYDDQDKNTDSNRGFFSGVITGQSAMRSQLIPSPAQFTICNREFLKQHSLTFYPGIYHEDAEFKPRVLFFASRFCSLNKVVYNYYQREKGSIMSSFNLKRGKDLITVSQSLCLFREKEITEPIMEKEFNYLIVLALNQMLCGMKTLSKSDQKVLRYILRKHKHLIGCMIKSKAVRHWIEGMFFMLNIKMGCFLYSNLR